MTTKEENEEQLNEAFKDQTNESKWKKYAIILVVCTVCAVILLIIFAVLYFIKEEEEKEENNPTDAPDNTDIIPEDEWDWKPVGDRIKTRWGINLDPKKVWQEYPRPQLERKEWMNLNGPWKYSIRKPDDIDPDEHDGYILVPFPLESSLSGVMKTLSDSDIIIYEKTIMIPEEWEGRHILLNFGAVDWKCEVFINKIKVGEHTGGYSYFYFDITKYLKGRKTIITLKVTDITDRVHPTWGKYQPVGKQTITPQSIWYTSASGIWQTVWLEPVSAHYIEKINVNNNYDNQEIKLNFNVANNFKFPIEYSIKFKDEIVANGVGKSNVEITINVSNNFKPWSPSEPNLYIITAELKSDIGQQLDSITSYTTIRKIEQRKDENFTRIYLNNKPIFSLGPLDQGYWPDGIYTPPSEEAMLFDMIRMKELGFNTLRKHAKTENFRYYYQCDKIGFLVWQDMPHGNLDGTGSWDPNNINGGADVSRTQESKDNYYKEWGEIIENLKFFQCIIIWTPFNEGWGQFETENVVEFTKGKDNLRLINAASGGNHRITGNFIDYHSYPGPSYPLPDASLIKVVGEYGGLGLEIKNHTWEENSWSYYKVNSSEELTGNYTIFIKNLIELVNNTGVSAAIYTQLTDVEGEINGLMTYDRNMTKIFDKIKEDNQNLINMLQE